MPDPFPTEHPITNMTKTRCCLTVALLLRFFVPVESYAQNAPSSWQSYTGIGYSAGVTLKDKLVNEAFSIGAQWIYKDRYIGGIGFQRSFFQEERRTSQYAGYSFITFTADMRILPSKDNGRLFLSGRTGIGLDDTAPFLLQTGIRYGANIKTVLWTSALT